MSERDNQKNVCWFFFDALKEIAEIRRFPEYLTFADHRALRRNGLIMDLRRGVRGKTTILTADARALMAEIKNDGK
jgi:hypothetical protein